MPPYELQGQTIGDLDADDDADDDDADFFEQAHGVPFQWWPGGYARDYTTEFVTVNKICHRQQNLSPHAINSWLLESYDVDALTLWEFGAL